MESSQNIKKNEEGSKTTIKLSNIKRNLSSELIHKILEKIFSKKRTYNAIYTVKKEYHIKNIGICFINFINAIYILKNWLIISKNLEEKIKKIKLILNALKYKGMNLLE